jgi:hypothetical protein
VTVKKGMRLLLSRKFLGEKNSRGKKIISGGRKLFLGKKFENFFIEKNGHSTTIIHKNMA